MTSLYCYKFTNKVQQLVSFTNGEGPTGYTELNATLFAQRRGMADAANALPYFAGSGQLIARVYPDRVLSNGEMNSILMAAVLSGVALLGLLAGLFVPRLPLDTPKRGFGLYSWLAAFHGDDVFRESKGLQKNMTLEEIESRVGSLKVHYRP